VNKKRNFQPIWGGSRAKKPERRNDNPNRQRQGGRSGTPWDLDPRSVKKERKPKRLPDGSKLHEVLPIPKGIKVPEMCRKGPARWVSSRGGCLSGNGKKGNRNVVIGGKKIETRPDRTRRGMMVPPVCAEGENLKGEEVSPT